MLNPILTSVFTNAALPQQVVLLLLLIAIPIILATAIFALRRGPGSGFCRRLIADLRVAGPTLGLLAGGLNSFHMGQTIHRLPFDPTLKQLTPGIFEVSTFVSLGALVGLTAVLAHTAVDLMGAQRPMK